MYSIEYCTPRRTHMLGVRLRWYGTRLRDVISCQHVSMHAHMVISFPIPRYHGIHMCQDAFPHIHGSHSISRSSNGCQQTSNCTCQRTQTVKRGSMRCLSVYFLYWTARCDLEPRNPTTRSPELTTFTGLLPHRHRHARCSQTRLRSPVRSRWSAALKAIYREQ